MDLYSSLEVMRMVYLRRISIDISLYYWEDFGIVHNGLL